ncbi:Ig domain-containing protein [Paenibacillus sp. PL91]|uniref:Ig-like domain-containing protein n=1 Tax=Paenibacillus sp. PL91 TaxID=2729538 RepID=UPI00145FBF2C|nr:Ig-like domain-containing protein [Paenibacillus sp. PL91]MBC9201878.1 Ig-like domain-containing protein [Paenibacillus sp. PL91]
MNFSLRIGTSLKETRRWLAAALAFVIVMTSLTGVANAAEDTVTGIEFSYDSSDYNSSTSSLETFVEDDKVNLTVFASISGSANKKDVTADATWKSSNTAFVKVEKGVLTGAGKGTATISATYKGFTISIKAASDYVYDSVTLKKQDGTTAPATLDIEIGQPLELTLDGTKGSTEKNVTSEAVWTTSNAAIATVDEGTITLLGVGAATITAKLKGKSDSITLNVSSPYKSITIDSGDSGNLAELYIGSDDKKLTASVVSKTGETSIVTDTAKWVSANDKVATVKKGVVTAVAAGKTTITVSHKGVSTSIDVVVRAAFQSIRLSPEKEYHLLLQDAPLQVTAEVQNNSGVSEDVTSKAEWTSSNVVVATVSGGLVTPKAVGATKITASHMGVSRSVEITVYPSVSDISVETETIDGFNGISGDLPKVTATTFDGSKVDVSKIVTWTSKDEKVAIVKDGQWTAKAIGETLLTATVQGKKVEIKLIVHVKPLKLIASVKDLSIILGKETPYPSVTVVNEDGEEEDITSKIKWKTTSEDIVLKDEVMKGLEVSSITLTATYLTKSVSVRVKVEEEIVKLVVEPAALDLYPGRSKSVKVTGYYKSGKQVSLGSKMNWESGNPNIASVSSTTVKAAAVGTTKITGSYQGKTVVVPIVVSPKLKSLVLSSKSVQLTAGGTYMAKLQANFTTGDPSNVTDAAVWTSSKASVATVVGGKIVAVSKGTASIKATYAGKSVTIRVSVK